MATRRRRRSSPLPSAKELYGEGVTGTRMRGQYSHRKDVLAAIQRRHERGMGYIDKEGFWHQHGKTWKVPYGVRAAFKEQLTMAMLASQYPFYVQWRHPDGNGGFKTLRRSCTTLGVACSFITTHAHRADEDAFVVCKLGFYVPRKLWGKFPRKLADGKTYFWCPRCMQPRRFRRVNPPQEFYADKKFWNEERGYYEWKNVKLALMQCSHCGLTNRDQKFRGSNQPVEKTVIKRRRSRIRRRK